MKIFTRMRTKALTLLSSFSVSKLALVFTLILIGLTTGKLNAQLLYADDFNSGYNPFVNLVGFNSWTKGGSGVDLTVQNAAPITYTNYQGGNGGVSGMPAISRGFRIRARGTSMKSAASYAAG